ncbi:hypothetical protein BFP97_07580 [Roseivirga sp. 4D4]|uniref:hypothetical protein n=1 Tax=Roseivirga sp. 4D4 TaxID=1889784 RepID=UPI000853D1EA|nr:hypothetical protein [Roseivirga sp. 4D4]OEK01386.1 hypothetical protein BFP97_07580 [Roseivirga sp. 4D4]
MELAITIVAAIFALVWSKNAKKKTTKIATVLLALSSLIQYDPYFGLRAYAIYFLIFFSFFAAIESMNSLRLTRGHQFFFLGCATVITFFQLIYLIDFPFHIPKYPFALLYIAGLVILWIFSRRKILTRLGVLAVWLGIALKWMVEAL